MKALITGITGQDGSYLADLLLEKKYEVYGMVRRSSTENFERINHIRDKVTLMHGDLLDHFSVLRIIDEIRPDEVYNLAAQSFVPMSWRQPILTGEFDALGVTKMLEAIRLVDKKIKFYQASSSEMFGKVREVPQTEQTPFHPRSPYGVAKVYGHWITVNYREAYGMHASNGILFNHESPIRGETFVSRKITRALARIKTGLQDTLYIGNLNARRDWGHARDFVEMQWLMLQQDEPEDYVIATGIQYSVKELIEIAAEQLGISIRWEGEGPDQKGIEKKTGQVIVAVDPGYYRPTEVNELLGDAGKARKKLGWEPGTTFEQMIAEMVETDMKEAQKDYLCLTEGFQTFNHFES